MEKVEAVEKPVSGWVLDNGVLRNAELDSSIALFNDAAHLLLNAQRQLTTLRATAEVVDVVRQHLELSLSDDTNLAEGVAHVSLSHSRRSAAAVVVIED